MAVWRTDVTTALWVGIAPVACLGGLASLLRQRYFAVSLVNRVL